MSDTTMEVVLTPEQQAVVDLPADTCLLVTAGAGAGKTHTMISRIARLLRDDELDSHEILVLSFARTAVRELTRRLDRTDLEARFVPVRTFDAFALELLLDAGENTEDSGGDLFDDRIAAAADLVRDGHASDRLEDLRHLVVDEAQDLVGVRLAFVEALLDRTGCAFTVVGDVAQSIYGFQIDDAGRRLRSADECFRGVRERYGDGLVERHLSQNFRALKEEAELALSFGPELRVAPADPTRVLYESLRTALMGAPVIGGLDDDYALQGLHDEAVTTAVLCRSNAETLIVSERLHSAGVPHRLRRKAQDRVAPPWLAELFRAHPANTLKRERLEVLLPTAPGGVDQDCEQVWRKLRQVAGDRGRAVDMGRLRDAISQRRLPDESTAQPDAALVVSSFHRAKGLEFDRVVVVDPGPLREDSDAPDQEEARLLYVAMTRPRYDLWRMDPLRRNGVRHWDRGDRIGRYGTGRYWRNHLGLEMCGDDVAADRPPGDDASARGIQDMLGGVVGIGAEVELWSDGLPSLDDTAPAYSIVHDGVEIGQTSEQFSTAMFRFLGGHRNYHPHRYPRRIDRIRIDAVETIAGTSEASGERAGLGTSGVWLAPRLGGLSSFDWKAVE